MPWHIRKAQTRDLPRLLQLQREAYSTLVESEAAIASRLRLAPDWCWVVESHGEVVAYLLTHPWSHALPPAWNTPLSHLPAHATRLYIHDLALGHGARGSGVARRLVNTALQQARRAHFHEVQLVAVQSSKRFWERFGFREVAAEGLLREKLRSYGDDACLMGMRVRR